MSTPDLVALPVAQWPEDLRPRERLIARGPQALADPELLAILLRTGTRGLGVVELAQRLLQQNGGLRGAAHLSLAEWARAPGVGPAKAASVVAALELGRRTWSDQGLRSPLSTPAEVYRYVAPRFFGEQRESLWILGLDARNVPVVDALVGAGTADRAPAHPREVFAPLLRGAAVKGVLAHNHPSGDPEPSAADLELTRALAQAGALLRIPIVDHIVVGSGRFVSLRERGYLT